MSIIETLWRGWMKKISLVCLLILINMLLFADPRAKVYTNDDPLLQEFHDVSIAAGILPLTSAGPVTGYDLVRQIESIQGNPLSYALQSRLNSLKESINDAYFGDSVKASILIFPELYGNIDDQAMEWDWVQRYNQRNPFIKMEAEAILADHVYGIMTYGLKRRLNHEDFRNLVTSFPYYDGLSETQVQNSVPHTAFMGLSGNRISFVMGRDTLGWGQGNTGNLTIGNHVPYHDFLHASASNDMLRYTFLAIPMNEIDSTGNVIVPTTASGQPWNTLFHGSLYRFFLAHRLEIDFTPRLRASLTEGTLFYTDRIDLRMFNPLMFIHNYQNYGEVNNTMTLEIETVLGRGWFLDFQFYLDQFQTAGEQDAYSDIPPNAYASLLGVNYVRYTDTGLIKAFAEGVYLSPYVYFRAGDNTDNYSDDPDDAETQYNLDLVHAVSMRYKQGGVAFLGYRYGPDTIVAATGLSFESVHGYGLATELRLMVKGERGLEAEDDSVENVQKVILGVSELNRPAPTGIPTYLLISSIGANYALASTPLKLWVRTDWIHRWHASTYDNDFQFSIGAYYRLAVL